MYTYGLREAEVLSLLSSPEVRFRLGLPTGGFKQAVALSDQRELYAVLGPAGDFILRFPGDEMDRVTLRKEARLLDHLRPRVRLQIPDTRLIDDLPEAPVFAIHRKVPGNPLTTEVWLGLSSLARDRLVKDLTQFFQATHSISLEEACDWLEIPYKGDATLSELTGQKGKPVWFDPAAVAGMQPRLARRLEPDHQEIFADTVRQFEALPREPSWMVFGHGDVHGYNVAMQADAVGDRLIGIFDFGCAGILDVHEDLFRLSLVSEDLLEEVLATYQSLPAQRRQLNRERIVIYYRAFLFYLMAESEGERLARLQRLLQKHIQRDLEPR